VVQNTEELKPIKEEVKFTPLGTEKVTETEETRAISEVSEDDDDVFEDDDDVFEALRV